MYKQNEYSSRVSTYPSLINLRVDPLSLVVMGRYARQSEMGDFLAFAGKWLVEKLRTWNRNSTMVYELNNKPDYLLRDIGIRRDQISGIVYGNKGREELSKPAPKTKPAPASVTKAAGLLPERFQTQVYNDLRDAYLSLSPVGGATVAGYFNGNKRPEGSVDFEPVFEKVANPEGNAKFDADLEKSLAA
ncbi:MAG: DUF1127 domain-containing protein [Rhodospirillales bacterium]|nr:DUF1127 domain-containing protein [Rhodospirillales bacterium]